MEDVGLGHVASTLFSTSTLFSQLLPPFRKNVPYFSLQPMEGRNGEVVAVVVGVVVAVVEVGVVVGVVEVGVVGLAS